MQQMKRSKTKQVHNYINMEFSLGCHKNAWDGYDRTIIELWLPWLSLTKIVASQMKDNRELQRCGCWSRTSIMCDVTHKRMYNITMYEIMGKFNHVEFKESAKHDYFCNMHKLAFSVSFIYLHSIEQRKSVNKAFNTIKSLL